MTTSNEQKIFNLCKNINIANGKLTDEFLFTIKMVDLSHFSVLVTQIAIENRLLEKKANCYFYITNEFIKTGTKYKYYIENPPKNVLCTKDDVLMTRTGNTGIVVTDIDGCFHNNFFKINYSRDLVVKVFLVQFFKLSTTQKRILVLAGSSTIPDLNHKDFYSLTIRLPCKGEQQKIADCLSSLDSLIQNQQKVVTTWQQRKKALLQHMFI